MKINKLWNSVLRVLLALFGLNVFTACYGPAPYSPYLQLKGKVVDGSDKPIGGIKVTVDKESDADMKTAEDGQFFYTKFCDAYSVPETLTLRFTDIDGPDNGGEFDEKTVTVNFKEQASKPEPMVVKMNIKQQAL